MLKSLVILAAAALALAGPTRSLGLQVNQDGDVLLNLGYVTHKASEYDKEQDIYTFNNIRFAAPPVGDLRWRKPQPPVYDPFVRDGSLGHQCIQSPTGPDFLGISADGDEDCLFLDLNVPGKAIRDSAKTKLPVLSWYFGGAYVMGDKRFLSEGKGLVAASNNEVIHVAGNYRLGAYGFLNGVTSEKHGLPNAGIHDQRAVLEWIKKYISLVGGNPDDITAIGESAGGSSIMHHLMLEDGKLDPLFRKAIIQSPAYIPFVDRGGTLEDAYKQFEDKAGCKGQGYACLRMQDAAKLKSANDWMNLNCVPGTFAFGVAPDGRFIKQSAKTAYAQGLVWKDIDALISQHVADEESLFVDNANLTTDDAFNKFVVTLYPDQKVDGPIGQTLLKAYPPVSENKKYKNESARVTDFIRESCFTCNNRAIVEAYPGKVWNSIFSISPASHGGDVISTYFDANSTTGKVDRDAAAKLAYQKYLTSFARSGDPNTYKAADAMDWPKVDNSGNLLSKVLSIDSADSKLNFTLVSDDGNAKDRCSLWPKVINDLMDGYRLVGKPA